MELIIGTIAIVAVLIVLAAVRVSRIASWRAVAMIAAIDRVAQGLCGLHPVLRAASGPMIGR